MKKIVIVLILVVCICIAFLFLIVDVANTVNSEARIRLCEDTLGAIGHAFEAYRANHEGSPPSSLVELKDNIKGRYARNSAGIPHCVGNRNEDETSDTSYYVYNPSLSTDENRPICWDSKAHHQRNRLLPDTYIWNVLYADGHVERLSRREFLSLMRSIGIRDPNNPSLKEEPGKHLSKSNEKETD